MSEAALSHTGMSGKRRVRNAILVGLFAPVFIATMYGLAFGSVVLNGTTSLSHNAYFMLRWPLVITAGSYVAFDAPMAVDERFRQFSFVKRVVGVPGDLVEVTGNRVCVLGDCRELQPHLIKRDIEPIAAMILGPDQYLVFGDAEDSLDSRYALIGPISKDNIEAVGFPIPFPHWKEIRTWFE